jgi:hypothetical protein
MGQRTMAQFNFVGVRNLGILDETIRRIPACFMQFSDSCYLRSRTERYQD